MAGYADFFQDRPGLPGPEQDPFGEILRMTLGRISQFQQRFPRGGRGQASAPVDPRSLNPNNQQLSGLGILRDIGGRY